MLFEKRLSSPFKKEKSFEKQLHVELSCCFLTALLCLPHLSEALSEPAKFADTVNDENTVREQTEACKVIELIFCITTDSLSQFELIGHVREIGYHEH